VNVFNLLISPIELPRVLLVVGELGMVLPHLGRKGNCLLLSKERRILGLKPNRNYLRQSSNKDLRLDFALIVVSKAKSLRLVLVKTFLTTNVSNGYSSPCSSNCKLNEF
jgi:hypothetical protein